MQHDHKARGLIETFAGMDVAALFWTAEAIGLAVIGGLALRHLKKAKVIPPLAAPLPIRRERLRRVAGQRARDGSAVMEDGGPARKAVLEEPRAAAVYDMPESMHGLDPVRLYEAMAVQRGLETTAQAKGEIARLLGATQRPGPRQVNSLVDKLDQRVQTRLQAAIAEPTAKSDASGSELAKPDGEKPDSARPQAAKRQPIRRPILRRRRALRHLITVTPTDVRAVTPDFLEAERVAEMEAMAMELATSRPDPSLRYSHGMSAPRPGR